MTEPDRAAGPATLGRRALGLGLLLAGCTSQPPAAPPPEEPAAEPGAIVEGVTALGDRLLREVALAPRAPVHVLSPYNLHATLGLLAVGARGDAAAAFARLLGMPDGPPARMAAAWRAARLALQSLDTPDSRLSVAYSGWTRRDAAFLPEWQARAEAMAAPRLGALDFADPGAAETINGWAREATRGEIPRVVDRLGADTELVLAGAIHFAGRWAQAFPRARTAPGPFRRLTGATATVPMMNMEGRLAYGARDGAHVVRLPYLGDRLAMWVACAQRVQDSQAFLNRIAAAGAARWIRETPLQTRLTAVRLPRFGFSAGGELLPALRAAEFGPALDGDLSGLLGRPVRVSQVVHQARIRVDEEGTVAAAATAVAATRSMEMPAVFAADRPFVFLVAPTEPGIPLFLGTVLNAALARG
jgi:serpin B